MYTCNQVKEQNLANSLQKFKSVVSKKLSGEEHITMYNDSDISIISQVK